jgi:CIC family chloride channel protein
VADDSDAAEAARPVSEPVVSPLPRRRSRYRFGLGIALVAVSAAAFAILFRWALGFVTHLATGAHDVVSAMGTLPVPLRLVLPALGGLLAGAVGMLVSKSRGAQGVGDVMEAVALGRIRLSMRVTLLKSLGSWLAIVTGGSLGREGPLIQFGGASGKVISDRLGLPIDDARLLVAAGTAAGFGAAYNTPFAAVLFVLEVVTGVVVLDAILPALIATVIAVTLTRAVVGEGPIYGQRAFHSDSPLELVAFAGLGIVAALGAQGFMRTLALGERLFQRHPVKLPWRPALGGLIAGAFVAATPEVAGNGFEALGRLLDGGFSVGFLLWLLVGKSIATTASVSSGSPGGVFTPILLIGGAIGYVFAVALAGLGVHVGSPGGYALVGMAAATAATTHAPLMAAVMVFELSGDYAIAAPLVLATAVATLLSRGMGSDSIYAAELRRRGVSWEITMEGRRVGD